ncbi:17233_t:CDS:1 [Racocetra persica]|uniref:17233_t:CDS:1 n=1 Tax=Racocetra persica TaxID=160502 RepID=A0ACA9QRE6_9GLOM|nr:17233_t:CDS:1 [Racocetra persica]
MSSKTSVRAFICTLLVTLFIIQALAIPVPNHPNKSIQPSSPTAVQPKKPVSTINKVKKPKSTVANAKGPQKTSTPPKSPTKPKSTAANAKGPQKTSTPPTSPLKSTTKDVVSSVTGKVFKGEATFYNTGLGACGITSSDDQLIAALPAPVYDSFIPDGNPNHCTACGKTATVVCGDKSVTVTIVDRCPGCKSGDIDLSPAAFKCLASPDKGRIPVTYTLN